MTHKTTTTASGKRIAGICLIAGAIALMAGCQTYDAALGSGTSVTATDAARFTRSGFLSDYARLKPVSALDGIECWRDPRFDAKQFDKVMVSRIVVSLAAPKAGKEGEQKTIDPSDLKTLTDYFHDSLVKALKPQMQVVDKAGPGVVVIRIALTDLVPTTVTDSVAGTLIPYAFIAEAGSGVATGRPAGSTPYMGETGMEMQFRDGGNGADHRRVPGYPDRPQVRRRRQWQHRRRGPDLGERLHEFVPGLVVCEERIRQMVDAACQAPRRAARRRSEAVSRQQAAGASGQFWRCRCETECWLPSLAQPS